MEQDEVPQSLQLPPQLDFPAFFLFLLYTILDTTQTNITPTIIKSIICIPPCIMMI